jgi:hypothetical protein
MEAVDNSKICYEQIYKSYWYANYSEFKVIIHKDLGYVNATQLCNGYKKPFRHWHANKGVKTLIAGLAERHSQLTGQTKTGDLESILQDAKKKPEPEPDVSSGEDSDGEDGDAGPVPPKLKKSFKIYVRKDPKYPYQAIETSAKGMAAAVKRFQKTPAGTDELLLEIHDIPDVTSLYNMIKSSGLVQTHKNTFTSKYSREVLLQKIHDLSWSNVTRAEWMEAVLKSDLAMSDDEQ